MQTGKFFPFPNNPLAVGKLLNCQQFYLHQTLPSAANIEHFLSLSFLFHHSIILKKERMEVRSQVSFDKDRSDTLQEFGLGKNPANTKFPNVGKRVT